MAEQLATLTGLSPTTARRRARTLLPWRRYVERAPASPIDLQLPSTADELRRTVARHNALAKQRVLEWLHEVPTPRFDHAVADLVRGASDGGGRGAPDPSQPMIGGATAGLALPTARAFHSATLRSVPEDIVARG